jgi:hypothetical protein
MLDNKKRERTREIKDLIRSFFEAHLNDEPEGLIIPKNMLNGEMEIVYEVLEGEEAEELHRELEAKNRAQERMIAEKRERQKERNRKFSEERKKKKAEEEKRIKPGLFDDV